VASEAARNQNFLNHQSTTPTFQWNRRQAVDG
jgi:hypothetical protein